MDLRSIVNETTLPWLLGVMGVFVSFALYKVVNAWRQSKRSPYFFLRQQAEKRLQTYLWATIGLLVMAAGTASFAWQPQPDNAVRMALLAQAKPVEAADDDLPVLDFQEDSPQRVEYSSLLGEISETSAISAPLDAPSTASLPDGISLSPVLPEEFDQVTPTVELQPDTTLTSIVFSTEIDDDYQAVAPRRVFGEGFFTIYATFDYEGMADGMAWSWVWRRNGEIVNGGNEEWNYGDDGPGWIYYEPPEGFQPGEYTLEIWVNGESFQRASLTIESEVANQ